MFANNVVHRNTMHVPSNLHTHKPQLRHRKKCKRAAVLPAFARAWSCPGRQQLTRLLHALSCFPSKASEAMRWLSVSMTTCLAVTWSAWSPKQCCPKPVQTCACSTGIACLHWKNHCESKELRQTLLACLTRKCAPISRKRLAARCNPSRLSGECAAVLLTSTGLRKNWQVQLRWSESTRVERGWDEKKEMKGKWKNGAKTWDKSSEVPERWWRSAAAPIGTTCFWIL